ncbi:f-box domain-containing protein [Trichonephila clavata]|uniref:F-box domain-containing protein n=1 Tax=Trichonephila clavata TaxID=2740835 RepID=A0A8X6LB47_TRICU|nr:f-box domain-containing protein [Trichonephila clavata]
MARDISSLPPEVLIGVFQFLDVHSRLKASLVSKTWLQIMDYPRLLSDVKIKFSGEIEETIKCFSRMTRHFQWFSFCRVIISGPLVEFLKNYSSQFVILSFSNCKVSDDKSESGLQDKILHCNNLRILDVFNSDIASLFATLPNLTELNLRLSSGLSDYVISNLSKSISKLEILLLGASEVYKEDASKTFYVNEKEMKIILPKKVCLSRA